jgi:hypothetical protein
MAPEGAQILVLATSMAEIIRVFHATTHDGAAEEFRE